jgi:hypothetical protein
MRFHIRYRFLLRSRSNRSSDSSSTPGAPRFARTSLQACTTSRFGISNGFTGTARSSPFGLARDDGPMIRPLRSGSITEPSTLLPVDPPLQLRIGTLGLAFARLAVSLGIGVAGSYSSTQEPESRSRHLYAGHRSSNKQVSDELCPRSTSYSRF